MPVNRWRQKSNPYNVTLVLLKFLLVPLAFYTLVLFVQLELKFGAPFDVLDATPETQVVSNPSVSISFYGLHLWGPYRRLRLRVYLMDGSSETPLMPSKELNAVPDPCLGEGAPLGGSEDDKKYGEVLCAKPHPFYSATFDLPAGTPQGKYLIRYDVEPDSKNSLLRKNRKTHFVYYQRGICLDAIQGAPIFVRAGQAAPISTDLAPMGRLLRPLESAPLLGLFSCGGRPWARFSLAPRVEAYVLQYQSTLTVTAVGKDTTGRPVVHTYDRASNGPGPDLFFDDKTLFPPRCKVTAGPSLSALDPKNPVRITFTGTQEPNRNGFRAATILLTHALLQPASTQQEAEAVLRSPFSDQNRQKVDTTSDNAFSVFVAPNEVPGSAYEPDRQKRLVVLFTSWLFNDERTQLPNGRFNENFYFDLDRHIVDPDGQNPSTCAVDITGRLVQISDRRFTLSCPDGVMRHHLHLTAEGENTLRNLTPGNTLQILITVEHEMNPVTLTLRINKNLRDLLSP